MKDEFVQLIKDAGVKKSSLCEKAGVTKQTMTNYIKTGTVNVRTLEAWCNALGYKLTIKKIDNGSTN